VLTSTIRPLSALWPYAGYYYIRVSTETWHTLEYGTHINRQYKGIYELTATRFNKFWYSSFFFCSPDTCVKLPLPLITSRLVTSSMRIRFVVYLDMAVCITSTIYGNWWRWIDLLNVIFLQLCNSRCRWLPAALSWWGVKVNTTRHRIHENRHLLAWYLLSYRRYTATIGMISREYMILPELLSWSVIQD